MIEILYQNNRTGRTLEIAAKVSAPKWGTKRVGSPSSFEFQVLRDERIQWEHGGIVAVKNDGKGLFYGYVFKLSETEKELLSVTAYDQLRYLKNKQTYVFKGKRADEVVAKIASDFKLRTGALANTGYVIPALSAPDKTLFDTILKALDETLVNTGKLYYLWDDYGLLRVSAIADGATDLIIGDRSLATGYTYDSEIDSDTYNRIKLYQENETTKKRDAYVIEDGNNIKFWGLLQDYEKVDENLNSAQIMQKAAQLLELKNKPKRSFSLTALSDLSIRAGSVFILDIKSLGMRSRAIVDEASHDLDKGTMTLKLVMA